MLLLQILELLLSETATLLNPVNRRGWTPLSLAAARGDVLAINILVARGADMTHQDHEGHVPRQEFEFEFNCCIAVQR